MRSHWPELTGLAGTLITTDAGEEWTIRHSDVIEDQASTRLALLLDLERDGEVVPIRLLFSGERHAVEQGHQTAWILDALRMIITDGELRQEGIYSLD